MGAIILYQEANDKDKFNRTATTLPEKVLVKVHEVNYQVNAANPYSDALSSVLCHRCKEIYLIDLMDSSAVDYTHAELVLVSRHGESCVAESPEFSSGRENGLVLKAAGFVSPLKEDVQDNGDVSDPTIWALVLS